MARAAHEIWPLFNQLYGDVAPESHFAAVRPLVAHYTSISTLEKIIQTEEMWLANPLFMNDIEEVRAGIEEGTLAFRSTNTISQALSKPDYEVFLTGLFSAYQSFQKDHVFDTYILCLSEHDRDDTDGLLSMWRGYGDSGRGAAIVFDSASVAVYEPSPLIFSKVFYGTAAQRATWFHERAQQFAGIVQTNQLAGEELYIAAQALFARLRLFSLFTKHRGFSEEREWRLAYLPERDFEHTLTPYLGYFIGSRGVEPKLKLPIKPQPSLGGQFVSLESLIHTILLGPSLSTPLSVQSVKRMVQLLNHPELVSRVQASRIPYRPTPPV